MINLLSVQATHAAQYHKNKQPKKKKKKDLSEHCSKDEI